MMSKFISAEPPHLRVVFDTNIYIAAFLRPGMSEELLKRGLRGEFHLYGSTFIFKEIERKLRQKAGASEGEIQVFLHLLESHISFVEPTYVQPIVVDDPDDDSIIACAKIAEADLLITLDNHLLRLKKWQGIAIMHPKTFSWIV